MRLWESHVRACNRLQASGCRRRRSATADRTAPLLMYHCCGSGGGEQGAPAPRHSRPTGAARAPTHLLACLGHRPLGLLQLAAAQAPLALQGRVGLRQPHLHSSHRSLRAPGGGGRWSAARPRHAPRKSGLNLRWQLQPASPPASPPARPPARPPGRQAGHDTSALHPGWARSPCPAPALTLRRSISLTDCSLRCSNMTLALASSWALCLASARAVRESLRSEDSWSCVCGRRGGGGVRGRARRAWQGMQGRLRKTRPRFTSFSLTRTLATCCSSCAMRLVAKAASLVAVSSWRRRSSSWASCCEARLRYSANCGGGGGSRDALVRGNGRLLGVLTGD